MVASYRDPEKNLVPIVPSEKRFFTLFRMTDVGDIYENHCHSEVFAEEFKKLRDTFYVQYYRNYLAQADVIWYNKHMYCGVNELNRYSISVDKAESLVPSVSARGGLNNLTVAEKSKLSQIIGKNVDELNNLPKSELRKLQIKFHPDKNPNNEEFSHYMFTILSNLIK